MNKQVVICQPDKAISEEAVSHGLSPLLANILGCRLNTDVSLKAFLDKKLADLPLPERMKSISGSANRVADAIEAKETIALICDYDCDGITSSIIFTKALQDWFGVLSGQLNIMIGLRKSEGYGISKGLINRMLEDGVPDLCISADCGSSDEERIAYLRSLGADVIVTDHHQIPEKKPPTSANFFVNPRQSDCGYSDQIAGCMVAFLLMCQVRTELIARGVLPSSTPKLTSLLSYVALGTQADCVSMADPINRTVVNAGLKILSESDNPALFCLRQHYGKTVDSDYLSFFAGPLINSSQRVSCPYLSYEFLMAETQAEAERLFYQLQENNAERKHHQRQGLVQALSLIEKSPLILSESIICLDLPESDSGIIGIVASKLLDRYAKPVVLLTTNSDGQKVGSCRSTPLVNIKRILDCVARDKPECFEKYGGHEAAAGFTLASAFVSSEGVPSFFSALCQAMKSCYETSVLIPKVDVDAPLLAAQLTIDCFAEMESLAPFGRGFDRPAFQGEFTVRHKQWLGRGQDHAKFRLCYQGRVEVEAIWFFIDQAVMNAFEEGSFFSCLYQLSINNWRGRTSLQLIVKEHFPV